MTHSGFTVNFLTNWVQDIRQNDTGSMIISRFGGLKHQKKDGVASSWNGEGFGWREHGPGVQFGHIELPMSMRHPREAWDTQTST